MSFVDLARLSLLTDWIYYNDVKELRKVSQSMRDCLDQIFWKKLVIHEADFDKQLDYWMVFSNPICATYVENFTLRGRRQTIGVFGAWNPSSSDRTHAQLEAIKSRITTFLQHASDLREASFPSNAQYITPDGWLALSDACQIEMLDASFAAFDISLNVIFKNAVEGHQRDPGPKHPRGERLSRVFRHLRHYQFFLNDYTILDIPLVKSLRLDLTQEKLQPLADVLQQRGSKLESLQLLICFREGYPIDRYDSVKNWCVLPLVSKLALTERDDSTLSYGENIAQFLIFLLGCFPNLRCMDFSSTHRVKLFKDGILNSVPKPTNQAACDDVMRNLAKHIARCCPLLDELLLNGFEAANSLGALPNMRKLSIVASGDEKHIKDLPWQLLPRQWETSLESMVIIRVLVCEDSNASSLFKELQEVCAEHLATFTKLRWIRFRALRPTIRQYHGFPLRTNEDFAFVAFMHKGLVSYAEELLY